MSRAHKFSSGTKKFSLPKSQTNNNKFKIQKAKGKSSSQKLKVFPFLI
jgi:hypothetical protein